MTYIESAEYFEEEINPNLYAGAAMIARMMIVQNAEIVDTTDMPVSEINESSTI